MKALVCLSLHLAAWGLMAADPAAASKSAKVDERYPYRVTWANEHLPWYQLIPGKFPPDHSDRRISGELLNVDAPNRSGQFRMTTTGQVVDFTMLPFGSVHYLNAEADLREVPVGTQMLFFLYEDGEGKLTRVSMMVDEYTIMAGHGWTSRLDAVDLDKKAISVTKQKLSKNQLDLGKRDFLLDEKTRIWRGDKQIRLQDLVVGESLLMNLTGKTQTDSGRCTDIWVGAETHAQVTARQWTKRTEVLLKEGIGAWVTENKNGQVSVTLFSNFRKDFKSFVSERFKPGEEISLVRTDESMRPARMMMVTTLREVKTIRVEGYGSSGVNLVLAASGEVASAKPGTFVRVFAGKDDEGVKLP